MAAMKRGAIFYMKMTGIEMDGTQMKSLQTFALGLDI